MWKENPDIDSYAVGSPQDVPAEETSSALSEIQTFAETNLSHLVKAECLAYHHIPSISIFCRMDIGIMEDDKGQLKYFVNEVTRGPLAATMFPPERSNMPGELDGLASLTVLQEMGEGFSKHFYDMLCSHHEDLKL
jgi:hypothetical protein